MLKFWSLAELMFVRYALPVAATCALAFAAHAADIAPNLPSLALTPPPSPIADSIWSGLYVGSEVFVVSGNGSKGHVGGAGEIGYDHEFENRFVVGVEAISGFSPALCGFGAVTGFDFAATEVRVGYDMGRWMPYLASGVILAKPVGGPQANYWSASQSANDLFSAPGSLRAAPTIGAGVEYAVTPNLHLDIGV